MANGRRQRVRAVVGLGVVVQRQDAHDHVGDLVLIGRARTDDRLLDLHGGILAHLDAGRRARRDRGTTRMRRPDGRAGVLPEVDALDGNGVGVKVANGMTDRVVDEPKPVVQLVAR